MRQRGERLITTGLVQSLLQEVQARRLLGRLRRWRRRPIETTDHEAVMAHLYEEGDISARYCVMVMLACGIAILGLLLSSPAVIIGAMLISPLMPPILLSGFSLATLDFALTARSLKTMALGTVLAVGLSALIVFLSPLNSVTPEILARTRPNFFDLMVAVLSAVAGAYAVARQKGETIVGVAIATALMPPLAVVGYGLATWNWTIFSGAIGLFFTNLLAISLTACLVARFFGFGHRHAARADLWRVGAILASFALLSVPLGLSLRQIAHESLVTKRAKAILGEIFPAPDNRIYGMTVTFPSRGPVEVETLVLTRHTQAGLESEAQRRLSGQLGVPVNLSLSQVPIEAHESVDRQAVEEMMKQENARLVREMQPDMAAITAGEVGVTRLSVAADPAARTVLVRMKADSAQRLIDLRAAQQRLARRYPAWHFDLQADPAALPPIPFAAGADSLDEKDQPLLEAMVWALKTSNVRKVQVSGYSDSMGGSAANRRAAARRAAAVGQVLARAGLRVALRTAYPAPNQGRIEREEGLAQFRVARVEPAPE